MQNAASYNPAASRPPDESRLQAGLTNLSMSAERLAAYTKRIAQVAGRIAGFEPEPPLTKDARVSGPQPVDSHLSRLHRVGSDVSESLDSLERQITRLEENAG